MKPPPKMDHAARQRLLTHKLFYERAFEAEEMYALESPDLNTQCCRKTTFL